MNINVTETPEGFQVTYEGVTNNYTSGQTLKTVVADCKARETARFEDSILQGIQAVIQTQVERTGTATDSLDVAAINREVARFIAQYRSAR